MAIFREVDTTVFCDICGEYVAGWHSTGNGVSRSWAEYFARQEGCTTGGKIVCKKCRIRRRRLQCGLIRRYGTPVIEGNGACMGFSGENDDEPIEKCKRCVACASFDWEEEKERLEIGGKRGRQ